MKIVKGDKVKVLYGKDAGKTGSVLSVNPKKSEILVDGLNKVTRHVKGDKKGNKVGGIVEVIRPIPVSKVQLVNEAGKATRVKYEIADGKKSRVAVKGGKKIETVVVKAAKKSVKSDSKSKGADKKEK